MEFNDHVYRFEDLPPLSDHDAQSPFAQFYYVPVSKPAPAVVQAIGPDQLDPAYCIDFENIDKLFSPDGNNLKNGWCIRPDGTGYSLIATDMPNATPEMEKFWMQWIMDPDYDYLNYRTWMPGLHISHAVPILENLGWGVSRIEMLQPLPPPLLGLSRPPQLLDPSFVGTIGSSGRSTLADHPEDQDYTILINCIKRTDTGLRVYSLCYMGMMWQAGQLVKMHDADPAKLRLFATHNAYEFHRKAELMPEVYAFSESLPNHGLNPNVKPPVKL